MGEVQLREQLITRLFTDCGMTKARPVAVGVSGGADSMALCVLLQEDGFKVTALTVDHGLRPESREEALTVRRWMARYQIPHHILTAKVSKDGNLQANARAARYRLLEEWCVENKVPQLAVGHHQDDQIETYLLHQKRGSVMGLSGMARRRTLGDVTLFRPFLPVPKYLLVKYLEGKRQEWVHDPSNDDLEFDRIKMRAQVRDGKVDTPQILKELAIHQQKRRLLERLCFTFLERHAVLEETGILHLPLDQVKSDEISILSLRRGLMSVGGQDIPPRWADIERAVEALKNEKKPYTLAGCYLFVEKDGEGTQRLYMAREPAAAETVPLTDSLWWDARFQIEGASPPKPKSKPTSKPLAKETEKATDYVVAALGESGWQQVAAQISKEALGDLQVPKRALWSLPAVWHLDNVVAVPHLQFFKDNTLNEIKITLRCRHPLIGEVFDA